MSYTMSEDEVLSAAINLAPQIRAMRHELDDTRHLPSSLAHTMAEAGLFQLHVPRAMGGPEFPPLTAFRVIEELSKVDGSVGWCAMIATAISLSTGWLDPDVGRTLFGQPPDVRLAGSIRPEGHAYPVEGGFRVRGHWDFASGIHHANWLLCTCQVMDRETPLLTAAGTPVTCSLLVPAASATIKDTWSVVGMCGTGSHDFIVDDVFVPATQDVSRTKPPYASGPLYDPRLGQMATWTSTAANALGIARGALDAFVDLATHTGSTMSTTLLRDRPFVQTRLAEAEAILSAARAYVITAVGTAWDEVCNDAPDPMPAITRARLAIAHSIHEAVRAVDIVFHAAGTNAVYRKHPLERYFRDIHVAVQHGAALPVHFETAGKILLGYRPEEVGW